MTKNKAILIDAGTGNLHSVHNAIRNLGIDIEVTSDPAVLNSPARIVLPGVGAFGSFMEGMRRRGLVEPVRDAVQRGDPMLGICVGMQALFEISEEMGAFEGLALLPGKVVHFPDFNDRKVPHTGWNQIWFRTDCPLFHGLNPGDYAYFNHSYFCANNDPANAAAQTDYGIDYTSAVQKDNLFGVQFHPEKSQAVGQKVLENFLKL